MSWPWTRRRTPFRPRCRRRARRITAGLSFGIRPVVAGLRLFFFLLETLSLWPCAVGRGARMGCGLWAGQDRAGRTEGRGRQRPLGSASQRLAGGPVPAKPTHPHTTLHNPHTRPPTPHPPPTHTHSYITPRRLPPKHPLSSSSFIFRFLRFSFLPAKTQKPPHITMKFAALVAVAVAAVGVNAQV